MIILDLETDGLLDTLTKVHCAVAYDTEKDDYLYFTPDGLLTPGDLPDVLNTYTKEGETISFHNGISFDLKVLKKLYNYEYKGKYRDTLLMARILFPDMESPSYTKDNGKVCKVKGPHSVEAWGVRLGIAKPVHTNWSEYSEEMLHRCKEDVRIQTGIYNYIIDYIDTLQVKDNRLDMESVFDMEGRVWKLIEKQSDYGWLFDLELGYKLIDELSTIVNEIDEQLLPLLPITAVQPYDKPAKAFKADGSLSQVAKNWITFEHHDDIMGDFSRVRFEQMNLGSDKQLKDYLIDNGWKPRKWNFKKDKHHKAIRDYKNGGKHIKTSPKLPDSVEEWDEIGNRLNIPSIKLIAERSKASHRLSSIKGYVKNTRMDHRIEAQANTCSCNTTRMAHRIVVNVPKAKDSVYYGKQMRSLFIAPAGKVLVGIDASALEARCEAHYIYPFDKEGSRELIEGDIHTKNSLIFQTDRDIAKSGKYCLLYGGSATKLASTLGKPKDLADELYEAYWSGNPGLKKLKRLVEIAYKKYGYLLSIDKRPLTIRYKHALINTLFQSCGSIAMKIALCIFEDMLEEKKLYAPAVGNFHDEFQRECDPNIAEEVGKLGVLSIKKAGEFLKLNIKLTGEYKIGHNWAGTH